MNELEQNIIDIFKNSNPSMYPTNIGFLDIQLISKFISKCSLSEFEKLKDLEYDLNQKDNE